MTIFDAVILSIVQGLTEFLPVSSSGHLKLVQFFLGLQELDRYMMFDLVCHLGTLLAIVIVFSKDLKDVFLNNFHQLLLIFIGTLPLIPLVFLLKPIKSLYASPDMLGYFFLVTSAILFLGVIFGCTQESKTNMKHSKKDALRIGLWQALAIVPGISRSGATISGARILGWSYADAVRFSFLLAIPAILGGAALEFFSWWKAPESVASLPIGCYLVGFIFSFTTGYTALRLLIGPLVKSKFSYFAWYCLFLGLATTFYFHLYQY
jgi:undecaprenyl-diphosphatase